MVYMENPVKMDDLYCIFQDIPIFEQIFLILSTSSVPSLQSEGARRDEADKKEAQKGCIAG